MLFIFDCRDKPDHQQVRLDNRAAHLDYLATVGDRLVAAGPTTTDDGATMTGSLLIIDFADRSAAEAFAAGDPYARAGLFDSVTIRVQSGRKARSLAISIPSSMVMAVQCVATQNLLVSGSMAWVEYPSVRLSSFKKCPVSPSKKKALLTAGR